MLQNFDQQLHLHFPVWKISHLHWQLLFNLFHFAGLVLLLVRALTILWAQNYWAKQKRTQNWNLEISNYYLWYHYRLDTCLFYSNYVLVWKNVTWKEWGKPSSELCPCSEAICENYCTTCYFQLKIKFRLVYNIWAGRHLVTVAKCPNIVLDDLINSRKTGHLSKNLKVIVIPYGFCVWISPQSQKRQIGGGALLFFPKRNWSVAG